MGPWRLRNYSTLNTSDGRAEYNSISTWIQRDIAALRSQIMIGDTWTASDIFDSTQIRARVCILITICYPPARMALLRGSWDCKVQRHRHHSAEWLRDLSVCRSTRCF
ncbi:fimbria/pilus outer membrane usher protein [Escherichia coli]